MQGNALQPTFVYEQIDCLSRRDIFNIFWYLIKLTCLLLEWTHLGINKNMEFFSKSVHLFQLPENRLIAHTIARMAFRLVFIRSVLAFAYHYEWMAGWMNEWMDGAIDTSPGNVDVLDHLPRSRAESGGDAGLENSQHFWRIRLFSFRSPVKFCDFQGQVWATYSSVLAVAVTAHQNGGGEQSERGMGWRGVRSKGYQKV